MMNPMANHRYRETLPRLTIPSTLAAQQPLAFDNRQPMFSPALPTTLQNTFHPPFPLNNMPLQQTPTMHQQQLQHQQHFFAPQPPLVMTHRTQASLAHFAAMGIHPQTGLPPQIHVRHPSMTGAPAFGQSLPPPPRSRRQPSIGGPPKAVLGGPARKLSPLPATSTTPSAPTNVKPKKVTVNLPKETIPGEDGQPATHPPWARLPLDPPSVLDSQDVVYPELTSTDPYPPESWYHTIPSTVFLPPKSAWTAIKHQLIEEKLEKLGVERGSGSTVPHIYAPHARAASISSPADPALLYFKLNKLQQSQTVSSLSSGATSPQPPFALSPSPHHPPPRFQRHGHSLSLAQPLMIKPSIGHPAALNPFGPHATLGSDQVVLHGSPGRSPDLTVDAPRSRVPLTPSFAPPLSAFTENRPNFARGFGLDIPEEEEEPQEVAPLQRDAQDVDVDADPKPSNVDDTEDDEFDGELESTTAQHSRFHSRHVSRLSAVLSLRSVEGLTEDFKEEADMVPLRSPIPNPDIDDLDQDEVGEWTGSEDQYMGSLETSEDESIGEWSNPSDEERARQSRVERCLRRRAQEIEVPRKIPNFPHPPQNTIVRPLRRAEDIVSNPSEEEKLFGHHVHRSEHSIASQRPLPPLPHSRVASGQFSVHDPAYAHSRTASDHFDPSMNGRRNSLNPFAKPFVFGVPRDLVSIASKPPNTSQAPTVFSHARLPSLGKPLSAAAQEFKPTGFNFLPPPGVPRMTLPPVETSRPLPLPPKVSTPVRAQQGREKRQRRDSTDSQDREGTMNSFRFPDSPERERQLQPVSPKTSGGRQTSLISSSDEIVPASSAFEETSPMPYSIIANDGSPDETLRDDSTAKAEKSFNLPTQEAAPIPSVVKVKRAPVPLDFKQAASNNTIPAGVFKALASAGDERTRRTVRSRLGSREIYEHMNLPSLDDLTMPPIAGKISRSRALASPREHEPPKEVNDVFGSHVKRRPSLPSAHLNTAGSSQSGISIPAVDLTGKFEQQRFEKTLEDILDDKLDGLRREILEIFKDRSLDASTVTEVVSLFHTQLQESAARGLENSQMDARGELDFELVKDVVQQGQAELRQVLRSEVKDVIDRLEDINEQRELLEDTKDFIEQLIVKTASDVSGAISKLSDRIQAIEPTSERGELANELVSTLSPILASLRSEPVDYEYLTVQLAQAVKPHISQLIDLASDKRETAGLIVDRILPLLPDPSSSAIDMDGISGHLISEVRRLIAPIDPFEIKEQVADLVVERLDSRFALRERTFNVDTISAKVHEGVARLLEPMQDVKTTLESLAESQRDVSTNHDDILAAHSDALKIITDLPTKLVAATEALHVAEVEVRSRIETLAASSSSDETISQIKSAVESLADNQKTLLQHHDELFTVQKNVLNRLDALPESLANTTTILQESSAAFTSSHETFKREADDLRKLNAEYQSQLSKARSAHGQARVEKDMLNESLTEAERERDALCARVKEMQVSAASQSSEATILRAKVFELEEGLKRGLEQLKANDVTAQLNQERIISLEKSNRDLTTEKQSLTSKIDSLQYQVDFAKRDKEVAERSLVILQQQYDQLVSQESRWESLQLASDKLDLLTGFIGQGDNEELKSLRQIRDRCNVLEGEHVALQRRVRDQEAKVTNSEKVAAIARQSLTSAQQRASEWEKRAQEYEARLELVQTKLDQAEQTHAQLDADYSLATMQLEEQSAESRLTKERENTLREQVSSLEREVTRLQDELEQAPKAPSSIQLNGPGHHGYRAANGYGFPDLHSSASFSSRTGTPVQVNGRRIIKRESPAAYTPSVRDSIHAPTAARASTSSKYPDHVPSTPKARVLSSSHRASIPSPTFSTVSLTPTQDEEGWWHANS